MLKKRYPYWQWCRRVDRVIAVSEAYAQMMERDYGLAKVYDMPRAWTSIFSNQREPWPRVRTV